MHVGILGDLGHIALGVTVPGVNGVWRMGEEVLGSGDHKSDWNDAWRLPLDSATSILTLGLAGTHTYKHAHELHLDRPNLPNTGPDLKQQLTGLNVQSDQPPMALSDFENFNGMDALGIWTMTNSMDNNNAEAVHSSWTDMAHQLSTSAQTFKNQLNQQFDGGWRGQAPTAAMRVIQTFQQQLNQLVTDLNAMGIVTNHYGEIKAVKSSLPSPSQYPCITECSPGDDELVVQARDQLATNARLVMTQSYIPLVGQVHDNVVTLTQDTTANPGQQTPDLNTSGGPGGPGLGGGGGGGGLSGGAGMPSIPGAAMPRDLKTATPTNNDGLPSALQTGLQQAQNLGQQGMSAMQQAAQQAMSALSSRPPGLGAIPTSAHLPTSAGLGGSKMGSGGGGGGGGGVPGLGGAPKSSLQPAAAKLNQFAQAEKGLQSELKGAARAEQQAASSGAGPMGGARGAGGAGQDKQHKANKYLVTSKHGKAVLGPPPAAVAAVIKAAAVPAEAEQHGSQK